MSREIGFRAWDGIKMHTVGAFILFTDGSVLVNDEIPIASSRLMQFTGLHDKNGKEIYEGDIVRLGKGLIVWSEEEAGFHIQWGDKEFAEARARITQRYESSEPIFTNAKVSLEIIGNIHETPELLK